VATYTWSEFIDVELFSLDTVTSSSSLPPALIKLDPSHTLRIDLQEIVPLDSYYDFSTPFFMNCGKLSVFNLISHRGSRRNRQHRLYSLTIDLPIEGTAVFEGISHVADSTLEEMPSGYVMLRLGEYGQSIVWMSRDEDGFYYLHFIDFTNVYPVLHQLPEVIHFMGGTAHGPGYGTVCVPDRILQNGSIQSIEFDDARGRVLLSLSTNQVAVINLI
jgi:hypothetical protein